MIYLLELLVILIGFLIVVGMFMLLRKLVPELDTWWKKVNLRDHEKAQLEEYKQEEERTAEKAKLAKKLNNTEYRRAKSRVTKTINERRVQ